MQYAPKASRRSHSASSRATTEAIASIGPEDVETPYVATYYFGADGYPYRCRTDFLAPAFEGGDESSSGPNRR